MSFCDPSLDNCPDAINGSTNTESTDPSAEMEAFEMLHWADHMMDLSNMNGQFIAALAYMSAAVSQAAWPTLVFFFYRFTTADWYDKYFKDITQWYLYAWYGLMGTNAFIFGIGFITGLFSIFGILGDFNLWWWKYGVNWGHGILQNGIVGLFAASIYEYNNYYKPIESAARDLAAGTITAGDASTRIAAGVLAVPATNTTGKAALTGGEGGNLRNLLIVELAVYMAATSYFNSHYNAWMWSFVSANTPSYDWETYITEQA